MIREDGTSTIRVVTEPDGTIVGNDQNAPSVGVRVLGGAVSLGIGDAMLTMPLAVAWTFRDLLARTLDASAVPAGA